MIGGDVVVNRKGEARIRRGHPWVFRTDVVAAEESLEPGALVRVLGPRQVPLGFALFSTRSEITLRSNSTSMSRMPFGPPEERHAPVPDIRPKPCSARSVRAGEAS